VKYLLDANILSEPTKATPDPRALEWLRAHEPDIAVDPVIIGELRFGILILSKGRKRTVLEAWFDAGVGRLYCLPLGHGYRPEMGVTACAPSRTGKAMPIKDSPIAATALVHDLAAVTRNRANFANTSVRMVDPFVGGQA
jgi:predicted nucleic acid-binding protein